MLFSSLTFLVWFFPAVILLHLILPFKWRNPFLLFASLFFYAWGEVRYLPLLIFMLIADWFFGLMVGKGDNPYRKLWLIASVVFNIGILAYYKYTDFILGNIGLSAFAPTMVMPLGISFFTFQITSYVIDVYRRDIPTEKNLVNVMTYTLLFPQLIAGPIVLYSQVRNEMLSRSLTSCQMEKGMVIFITGLAGKVLLANPLGALFQNIISMPGASAPSMWLATALSAMQLYFDFAGYSAMAIGMGHMLGFTFPKNFDHPFAARSIREFWSRWHMTLGTWLRQYLYIPLGGSRKGKGRTFVNLFISWFVSGLWHGADWMWVSWALWFFVLVMLEKNWLGPWLYKHPGWGWFYTQLAFMLGMVIISYDSFTASFHHFTRMFSMNFSTDILYLLSGNWLLFLLSALCCVPATFNVMNRLMSRLPAFRIGIMGALMVLSIAALVNEAYNPFIYFRF